MKFSQCDLCHQDMEVSTEHLSILHHGALVIDIKVGINQPYEGDICTDCIRKNLVLIAEKGIFVGRKITLPEDVKPMVEAKEIKKSWLIR